VLVQHSSYERIDPARAPTHPSPLRDADLSPEGEEVKHAQNSLLAGNIREFLRMKWSGMPNANFQYTEIHTLFDQNSQLAKLFHVKII
jgi:hypothetical protein